MSRLFRMACRALRSGGRPAVLAVLALLVVEAPARAADKNLLVNPGFEQGVEGHEWMPAGWDTSRAGTETVIFTRDAYAAHTGSVGAGIANASTAMPLWHNWSQSIEVTPDMWNKDIVLTVWTKNNGVDGRGYVLLQCYRDTVGVLAKRWKLTRDQAGRRSGFAGVNDPVLDLGWKREAFVDRETEWVQRKLRLYLPPTTNFITVRLGLFGSGQVLYDDASLTLENPEKATVPPLRTNLLGDPGFEQGGIPWELSIPIYPDYTAQPDTLRPHSGSYAFHFNQEHGLVAGRAGVSQPFCNRALSGKRVRFSAFVRADSLRSQVFATLYFHTRTGSSSQISEARVSGTEDWTQLVVEGNAPKDTYTVWAVIELTAPVPGHAYVDDASFEVLGPATEERASRTGAPGAPSSR